MISRKVATMRSVSVGRRPAITSSSSSNFGSVASARATSSRLRSGNVSVEASLAALVEQIEPPKQIMRAPPCRGHIGMAQQCADDDIVLDAERGEWPHKLERACDAAPAHHIGRQPFDRFTGKE